mmetsp:Transcript_37414/g.98977  ORF Transcript_37414/g.98977 Transcript_37414/m.98977 type:complete len:206 (-) Transcript_37414:281-898(-)
MALRARRHGLQLPGVLQRRRHGGLPGQSRRALQDQPYRRQQDLEVRHGRQAHLHHGRGGHGQRQGLRGEQRGRSRRAARLQARRRAAAVVPGSALQGHAGRRGGPRRRRKELRRDGHWRQPWGGSGRSIRLPWRSSRLLPPPRQPQIPEAVLVPGAVRDPGVRGRDGRDQMVPRAAALPASRHPRRRGAAPQQVRGQAFREEPPQ